MTFADPRTLCPICGSGADPVLTDAEIFVKRTSEKKVGAELKAFHCKAASHVFFVRSEDLAKAVARMATTEAVAEIGNASAWAF